MSPAVFRRQAAHCFAHALECARHTTQMIVDFRPVVVDGKYHRPDAAVRHPFEVAVQQNAAIRIDRQMELMHLGPLRQFVHLPPSQKGFPARKQQLDSTIPLTYFLIQQFV